MKIHIWQALHDTEARREMEKESLEQMIRSTATENTAHGRASSALTA